jgi:hypothetical protein
MTYKDFGHRDTNREKEHPPRISSAQVVPDPLVDGVLDFVMIPTIERRGIGVHTSSKSGRCDLENLTEADLRVMFNALKDWFEKTGIHKEA